jgi:hypothetical protein
MFEAAKCNFCTGSWHTAECTLLSSRQEVGNDPGEPEEEQFQHVKTSHAFMRVYIAAARALMGRLSCWELHLGFSPCGRPL